MSATKDKFSPVLNYVSLLEHIRRRGSIAPFILHLGTGWKAMLTLQPRRFKVEKELSIATGQQIKRVHSWSGGFGDFNYAQILYRLYFSDVL